MSTGIGDPLDTLANTVKADAPLGVQGMRAWDHEAEAWKDKKSILVVVMDEMNVNRGKASSGGLALRKP